MVAKRKVEFNVCAWACEKKQHAVFYEKIYLEMEIRIELASYKPGQVGLNGEDVYLSTRPLKFVRVGVLKTGSMQGLFSLLVVTFEYDRTASWT